MKADRRIEKLRPDHPIEGFDCGREELNRYLLRYAWQNQQAGAGQTYLGLVGTSVIGYHTLAVGYATQQEAPARLTKGLARHPVPIMLLARLAVDRRWHGQGVAKHCCAMQCSVLCRLPILPESAPSQFTPKMKAREAFIRSSISLLHRPIPCICLCFSRTCAGPCRKNS
ncbi:MAG TPA: hypothetical protein VFB04_03190, partial [Terriglobales bacterium]|nr:hypothetical protein [Terriglobales bacterium]